MSQPTGRKGWGRYLAEGEPSDLTKAFREACERLHLKHRFTRAYRPQTNGKAERFIQSALREWAYGIAYRQLF